MNEQFYQGDVLLIRRLAKARKTIKGCVPVESRNGRIVLARGEKTGHDHTTDALVTQLFGKASITGDTIVATGPRTLVVYQPTEVVHQEHDPIQLVEGEYEVRLQRQHIPEEQPRLSANWD